MSGPVARATHAGSGKLRGGCHCGRVRVLLQTAVDPPLLQPRACDCSYCRRHGAGWISDPRGHLRIEATSAVDLGGYRQGSQAPLFRLCRECGVLVAVTCEDAGQLYGAVNAACLEDADRFADRMPVSPQRLPPDERRGRWLQLWVPDVVIEYTG